MELVEVRDMFGMRVRSNPSTSHHPSCFPLTFDYALDRFVASRLASNICSVTLHIDLSYAGMSYAGRYVMTYLRTSR